MHVARATCLELRFIGVHFDWKWSTVSHQHQSDELGHTVVKVAGGIQHIPPYQLMIALLHILLNKPLHGLPVSVASPSLIKIGRLAILFFSVGDIDAVAPLEEYRGKIGVPPEISTGQCPEILKKSDQVSELLNLYNHHWRDSRFRDCSDNVEETYSSEQQAYFALEPGSQRNSYLAQLLNLTLKV